MQNILQNIRLFQSVTLFLALVLNRKFRSSFPAGSDGLRRRHRRDRSSRFLQRFSSGLRPTGTPYSAHLPVPRTTEIELRLFPEWTRLACVSKHLCDLCPKLHRSGDFWNFHKDSCSSIAEFFFSDKPEWSANNLFCFQRDNQFLSFSFFVKLKLRILKSEGRTWLFVCKIWNYAWHSFSEIANLRQCYLRLRNRVWYYYLLN